MEQDVSNDQAARQQRVEEGCAEANQFLAGGQVERAVWTMDVVLPLCHKDAALSALGAEVAVKIIKDPLFLARALNTSGTFPFVVHNLCSSAYKGASLDIARATLEGFKSFSAVKPVELNPMALSFLPLVFSTLLDLHFEGKWNKPLPSEQDKTLAIDAGLSLLTSLKPSDPLSDSECAISRIADTLFQFAGMPEMRGFGEQGPFICREFAAVKTPNGHGVVVFGKEPHFALAHHAKNCGGQEVDVFWGHVGRHDFQGKGLAHACFQPADEAVFELVFNQLAALVPNELPFRDSAKEWVTKNPKRDQGLSV